MKRIIFSLLLLVSASCLAQSSLGSVVSFTSDNQKVTIQCTYGQIEIAQCAEFAWKVSSIPTGKTLANERKSISMTHEFDNAATVHAEENTGTIFITNGFSNVKVDKATALVSFYDGETLKLTEKTGIDNTKDKKTITFEPQGENAFYGGGYNGISTNMEGKSMLMNNTQNYAWSQTSMGEGDANNICIPFIVSSLGYGILFEDHYMDAMIFPSGKIGTTYTSDSPDLISYVYIGSENGDMDGVMQTYANVTGRHELPPYWALGYICSRYGYHSQEETESVIASLEKNDMPVSAVVLDLFWEGEMQNGMGNLDWYRPMWPKAEEMMSDFKKKGVHTIIITEPYFAEETTNYPVLLEKGLFVDPEAPNMSWVSDNKVGLIDFMNPKAVDWMWDFYKARTDEGVDGWWLDLGEPEMIHDDAIHADGSTVKQAHNEFGMHWIADVWNKWKQTYPDRRPLFMPRSGTSGMQRYATYPWTGDIDRSWDGLKAQVPALVNGGMSGLGYLSSDIGGFVSDTVNVELYLRWFQLGVFTPVLRTHGQYLPEPYNDEYAEIRDDLRSLLNLRYAMLPYNYSSAWRNATLGTPITMPIDYYGIEPVAATRRTDEYLFGPNILVAPIMTEGSRAREVYLPAGEWTDMNTGERFMGSRNISFSAADSRMPLYFRCGTFTPMLLQQTFTNTDEINFSDIKVIYPIGNMDPDAQPFTMYDDDKTSANVGDRFETFTFTGKDANGIHTVTIQNECRQTYSGRPTKRTFHFEIPMGQLDAKKMSVSGDVTDWKSDGNTLYVNVEMETTASQNTCSFTISPDATGVFGTMYDSDAQIYNLKGIRTGKANAGKVYIQWGQSLFNGD